MSDGSQQKRLALFFNAFWINRAGMSGGDKRFIEIFKRIGAGYRLDIYTSEDGRNTIGDQIPNANFVLSPSCCNSTTFYGAYLKRTMWAAKRIRESDYDLLYGSSDFFPDVIPCHRYRKRFQRTKWLQCIFHVYPPWRKRHGNPLRNLLGILAQHLSFSLVRNHADLIVNLNRQVGDELRAVGFPPEKITVNPCGVDTSRFESLRADRKPFQACFLGRLAHSKGIFDLVAVWKQVVSRIPNARLKIIGSGPDEFIAKLKTDIEREDLTDKIEICGFLPDDNAMKIVKESRVFLFPSHEEGFGIVIAEAQSLGVPVVAWDLPVFRELFPEGLVRVPENDFSAFADATIIILTNDAAAGKLAAEGKAFSTRYNWDTVAAKECELIEGLL